MAICASDDFLNIIKEYDVICFTETWTNKNSDIELKGYSKHIHSYRQFQHHRAKRSSGRVLIYIKDSICKGVQVVKNDVDCLVWLKFDKAYFDLEDDIYLGVIYIAPKNLPIHTVYDTNIFQILEDDISFFNTNGNIFITGDSNCRGRGKRVCKCFDRVLDNDVMQAGDSHLPRTFAGNM